MRLSISLFSACLLYLFLCSCKKLGLCRDGKLQIPVTEYTGSNLRTDGYYSDESIDTADNVNGFILYRNGVAVWGGLSRDAQGNINAVSQQSNVRSRWGAYLIEGSTIDIEWWLMSYTCHALDAYKGTILNDTTFLITTIETIEGRRKTNTEEVSQTYHFNRLEVKPDSLNDFVP